MRAEGNISTQHGKRHPSAAFSAPPAAPLTPCVHSDPCLPLDPLPTQDERIPQHLSHSLLRRHLVQRLPCVLDDNPASVLQHPGPDVCRFRLCPEEGPALLRRRLQGKAA